MALSHGNYYDFIADVVGFINETAEDYNHDFRIGLIKVKPQRGRMCGVSRSKGKAALKRKNWQNWTTLEKEAAIDVEG